MGAGGRVVEHIFLIAFLKGPWEFFIFNTYFFYFFCMIFLRISFCEKFMEKLWVKVLLKRKKKKSVYIFCSLSWNSLSLIQCSYFNKTLCHNKLLHNSAPGYKGWKKKIASGKARIFSFLIMILNDFSLLYYLNFNLWCPVLLQIIIYSV